MFVRKTIWRILRAHRKINNLAERPVMHKQKSETAILTSDEGKDEGSETSDGCSEQQMGCTQTRLQFTGVIRRRERKGDGGE
jgi:hypothetical protein